MNKKKQNKKNPHEKPISIPLEFEDAVKEILLVKPPKGKNKRGQINEK